MKRAARSRSRLDHATLARISFVLGATLVFAMFSVSTRADDSPMSHRMVLIPSECVQYWSIPGGTGSPAGWNQVLSFAACVQDATVARIEDVEEIEGLVEELQTSLEPAVQLYVAAIEQGPGPVKVRATLQLAMAEAALITRARSSIVAPADLRTNSATAAHYRELHERLEPMVEPQAMLACTLVSLVDRAVASDPTLAPDRVTKLMLAYARKVAALLHKSWSSPDELDTKSLLVAPHQRTKENIWLDFMSLTPIWTSPTHGSAR